MFNLFKEKVNQPSNRVLWLTDTFDDHNGVSMVLQAIHKEIKCRNLPIDIMVCSNKLKSDRNLIVVKPFLEFNIPLYRQQPLRIPNYFKIRRIFRKGNFDRILSSTEGPMGFTALYFKKFYAVKTYFYLHTDWIMFAKQVMGFQQAGLNRLQYLMRAYYNTFDYIFVLNSDQQKWLTGKSMRFDSSRILMTAHWTESIFLKKENVVFPNVNNNNKGPVLLLTGRISPEKGIFELPGIFRKAKESIPGLRMLIAGTGPSENELRAIFPEAEFTGWIDHDRLPEVYKSADLLILPSRFDTFSCVVLEALSCGLPVIAYNTKGPKDIIQDSVNGFLAETAEEMSQGIVSYLSEKDNHDSFKKAAVARANDYTSDRILKKLLQDIEIIFPAEIHDAIPA